MQSKCILFVSSLMLAGITLPSQASGISCESKKSELRTQIDYARSNGNAHQVSGLEKALREVTEHCSDELLRQENQLKVQEKENKVAERQRELAEARQSGNQEKIDKKLKKLREAEEELTAAKSNAA
ncbi:DUF1090 domain-containing protein [Serratia rubidaea]|uniref:Protein of uncharacterized function (DUF1090) n=1 Tax=Serratia rubidaea TaxID=61652 RepID=A0A3S4WGW7_SERRU|nr:DUF1090 domain-containing protein [Serratia rubidaea]VEI65441.1 Protein of uncharacterised function (DUF1090) [Serratia rubidaea]